jgi:hypothetical protein
MSRGLRLEGASMVELVHRTQIERALNEALCNDLEVHS